MPLDARVAVVPEAEAQFAFQDVTIDDPGPHEVRVRVVASGVCHTDASVRDGILPASFPQVLGHEGSGIIDAVGSHVTDLKVGDPVVMTYGSCGRCECCAEGDPAYCEKFVALNFEGERQGKGDAVFGGTDLTAAFFQQSSFGTYALAHERNVVKVPEDVDIKLLGPLGCGIQTGAGTVLNTLKPQAGQTIAVFGVGSVGLSAIMAARVAGCATIIAVDLQPERLKMAQELGATHTVNSNDEDPADAVRAATNGKGAHYALECTGLAKVAGQANDALRQRGTLAIVGAPPGGTDYAFDANDLILTGRRIVGAVEGDSIVKLFIPRLIELWQQGRFPFDRLVKEYAFEDLNQAFADMHDGKTIKPIVVMPGQGG